MGILRLEKRTIMTFASKLYQEEEVRLRGILSPQPDSFVPDHALNASIATAIEDPQCSLEHAKALLQ